MDESEFYDSVDSDALYDPVLPDIREWPIYKLSRKRRQLMESVGLEVVGSLLSVKNKNGALPEMIASAYQQEKQRIRENPWKADPADEEEFWRKVKRNLQRNSDPHIQPEISREANAAILEDIVKRYTSEIAGNFRVRTFRFAKRATNFGFTRLLSAATEGFMRGFWNPRRKLREKIIVTGELETIRSLSTKGVLLLLPTHFSNLDSVVLGWAIEAVGLPAVTYGAGINLFSHPVLAYFMNRLGGYKVDRRKKNEIYLSTLKTYATQTLVNGCHMLFFPGGTRSRSGGIEKNLKLGLLSTAIEAQRRLLEGNDEKPAKIYVVPVAVSYHVVLEGKNLIDSHLQSTDKERAVLLKDDFSSLWKNIRFIWKFLKSGSEMTIRFGSPLDLFGNFADANGNSLDRQGKPVDIRDYFLNGGVISKDSQRDAVFTENLGEIILDRYYKENIVFSSHVVAFTGFESFRTRYKHSELFEFLRMPEDEMEISQTEFEKAVAFVIEQLITLRSQGRLRLAPHLDTSIAEIIRHGISNLGIYHVRQPLSISKDGVITTKNLRLLYYYRNRLDGYGIQAT